jgi:ribosomal protein S18 acetylase RimI-like enzyme
VIRNDRPPSRTSKNDAPDGGNTVTVVMTHRHPDNHRSSTSAGTVILGSSHTSGPSLGQHPPSYGTIEGVQSTEHSSTATPRVVAWSPDQFALRVADAMDIYVRAMHYPPHAGSQRAVTARRHATHHGFSCRAALLDDGRLVGFGYGYTTTPGQWWHDLVRKALDKPQAQQWLGNAFELSELHVLPEFQGTGTGRRLLTELAGSLNHDSMLLSTPDIDTRAFRLYRHLGFVDLRRHYLFPGDIRPFAVLGAHLPLQSNGD